MSEVLLFTVLTLCIVGVLAAVVLYFVAQKFKVYEDPRIDAVESMLPGANCGGCGYPGCRGLADALVGQRRSVVAVLYGRRRRDDEEDRRISGESRPGKRTGSRGRSLQRQLRKASPDQYIRRSRLLRDRGDPVRRRNGLFVRLPRRGRLRVGLRFRGFVDRFAKRVACRERSALHRLRCLRQGLSQRHYRASQERSERPQGLRRVRKQGQRRHSAESLRLCLHRMRQMSENMFFRCDYITEQFSIYRCGQMSLMP